MQQHPLRHILNEELHTRPFHDFEGAGRFIRLVYLIGESEQKILRPVNLWLSGQGRPPLESTQKFRREEFDNWALRIERHGEFVTISFIMKGEKLARGLAKGAFDQTAHRQLPVDLMAAISIPVFHAIWLEIGGKPPAGLTPDNVSQMLECRSAASNLISDGAAQIHMSFDIDSLGYSRMMLFNKSISANRMGRIVQRMVELETYRMLALLGLPLVRENSAELSQIEEDLQALTGLLSQQISASTDTGNTLLAQLSGLAAQIEKLSARASFRLAASAAYRDIFMARLQRLAISRLEGHQGIAGFLDRRMMPAMQSCIAFSARLQSLSERVERTGSLLRTHTDLVIQNQNTNLLSSMDRRASAQLRLQQTVEGLSVIAGTYYGVGLVGILAKAWPFIADHPSFGLDSVKAASTPFVALAIWLIVRRGSRAISAKAPAAPSEQKSGRPARLQNARQKNARSQNARQKKDS